MALSILNSTRACHIALTQGCQSCTFSNGQVCCYNCIKNFSCHYLLSENIKKQLVKRYKHIVFMQSVDINHIITPKPWIFTFTMNYAIYSVKIILILNKSKIL